MSTLQDKYSGVIDAAKTAGITDLQVTEQDGILYVAGNARSSAEKDTVWNALGAIDPTYSASDINVNVQVAGLVAGAQLVIDTESTSLNLRQQANTEATIVGKAAKGETVTLVEQTSDDWWKIKTATGDEGYAYARYLKA